MLYLELDMLNFPDLQAWADDGERESNRAAMFDRVLTAGRALKAAFPDGYALVQGKPVAYGTTAPEIHKSDPRWGLARSWATLAAPGTYELTFTVQGRKEFTVKCNRGAAPLWRVMWKECPRYCGPGQAPVLVRATYGPRQCQATVMCGNIRITTTIRSVK